MDDFRDQLSSPNSYSVTAIDKRAIRPIRQELTVIFKGLTIKKKYGKSRGKPVVGYQFSFKPEIKKQMILINMHQPKKNKLRN
ncbi:hypothetical protein [Enterococcus raffinosus]|uniref:hypothetical protein n=1 Tax=Enterococcus raffinosus TaxID=71452 RepID=UPI0036F1C681